VYLASKTILVGRKTEFSVVLGNRVMIMTVAYLPSLFMADWKHLARRHARHWLRWVLSTGHRPLRSPVALQV